MAGTGPQIPIRALREAHGLKLVDLAEKIKDHGVDVDPDSLSNVERGHKRGSNSLMVAWAKALGISVLDVQQLPSPKSKVTAT